jgi:putative ABC transport system permease protein
LLRQLLTEGALLSVGGGILGILLASWWMDLVIAAMPSAAPFWMRFTIDRTVLLFTLGIALLTALLFGLAPALHSVRAGLQSTLKEGRGMSSSRSKTRIRATLVVAQLALAVILLAGGLLMVRSFLALRRVDPGFTIDQITALNLDLPGSRYDALETRRNFYDQLLGRLRILPGIAAAGAVSNLPIGGSQTTSNFSVQGRSEEIEDATHRVVVTPGYFAAMGITLQRGRDFASTDRAGAQRVAIINQRLAELYFKGRDPIGQRVAFGAGDGLEWLTVVGVVRNINQSQISQTSIGPDIYLPMAQVPERRMSVVVRTSAPIQSVLSMLRREVEALDPNIPLFNVKSMGQVIEDSVWDAKLTSSLFAAFALAALLLAAIGLYGVIAYSVTQRTKEMGVRVALGARPRAVMKLIVGQGAKLALTGVLVGLAGALVMGQVMSKLLFGVRATDPFTFLAVALLLAAVALFASYVPARRALRVDPITALRME